jgi:Tol biopolymer transport system component
MPPNRTLTALPPDSPSAPPDLARRRWLLASALGAGAALAGCGGGGGGSDEPAPPAPPARRFDATLVYGTLGAATGQQLYLRRPGAAALALAPQWRGGVDAFALSADGRSVVCIARETANAPARLYRIDLDAPDAPVRLSPLPAGGLGSVRTFRLSPDGERVAFSGDLNTRDVVEIYVAPIRGSTVLRVSANIGTPPQVEYELPFPDAWSPDGRYLLQRVLLLQSGRRLGFNVYDRLGGPDSFRLSGLLPVPGSEVDEACWLPDSSGIAYVAQARRPTGREPLISRLATPMSAQILLPRTFDGLNTSRLRFSPDGRTLYLLSNYDRGLDDLYALPVAVGGGIAGSLVPLGGPRTQIHGPVRGFVLSPDGSRVAYLGDEQSAGTVQLLEVGSAAVANAPATRMNGPLGPGESVSRAEYTPDGASLVYRAGSDAGAGGEARHELHRVLRAAPTQSQRLSGPLVAGASVDIDFSVHATPRGTAVLHAGDLLTDRSRELFAGFIDEPGLSQRLNDALPASGRIGAWSTL